MKTFTFHPFLIALYFPLFLYSINIDRYSAPVTFLPALILQITTIIVFGLLLLIFKDKHKAALLLSVNLLLIFSYGSCYALLKGCYHEKLGGILGAQKIILLFDFTVNILLLWAFWKTTFKWSKVSSWLNRISCVLLIFPTLQVVKVTIFDKPKKFTVNISANEKMLHNFKTNFAYGTLPDIYHIVMDAYPRNDVLKEAYNYDNSSFINYLRNNNLYLVELIRLLIKSNSLIISE